LHRLHISDGPGYPHRGYSPMHSSGFWSKILIFTVLLFLAGSGFAHLIAPERFMKPWHRQGGKMLSEWNRLGIRAFGAILASGAIYILYEFFRD
jgi:hypothetical protein